jgi:phosphatidylglycerol:prolipoprotein diacylglycerol transferase
MQVRRSAAKIMLPNLYIPELKIIGPVTVKPFGVLVALSILIGYWLAIQRAKRTGLDMQIFADCLFWALAGGFLGAHLFWAFFYNPQMIKDNPLVLLKIWEGISSFGGESTFFSGERTLMSSAILRPLRLGLSRPGPLPG